MTFAAPTRCLDTVPWNGAGVSQIVSARLLFGVACIVKTAPDNPYTTDEEIVMDARLTEFVNRYGPSGTLDRRNHERANRSDRQ